MQSPRRVAVDILINIESKRRHPDDLLSDAFKKHRSLTDLDRAFVTELVYGTLRWQGKIDWVIQRFSTVRLERMERAILQTLRMGAYQLLFLTKTPYRAAVNESVNLAKKLGRQEAAGFVNAVLRRIIRERETESLYPVEGGPQEILAVEEAFPLWAVRKLWVLWGENETRAFCRASNQHAPLTLRANVLKTDRMSLMERMRAEGLSVSATAFSPDGVTIQDGPPVSKIPFLGSGIYQVQDEAAQLIAYLVNPKPGEKILDACAAPGTKTTHLAQLMENRGTIHALDINGQRLRLLRESCRRMGITNVTVLKRDVTRPLSVFEGQTFDAILVDAPCTGWGTIRRNPDIKWQTGLQDISRLALSQGTILDSVSGLLRVEGRLIYTTCTVFEEENERVVSGFLQGNVDFRLDRRTCRFLDETLFDHRGFFRTLPHRHKTDGFFGARLVRV